MPTCKKKSRKYTLSMIFVCLLLMIILIGTTFAWLFTTVNGKKTYTVTVGTLDLDLKEEMNTGILLEKTEPMSDKEGLSKSPYKFSIENIGNIDSKFILYLDNSTLNQGESLMEDKYIKYNLVKNKISEPIDLITKLGVYPYRVLDIGTIKIGEKNNYELKLWIDSKADNEVLNKIFKAKIRLEAIQLEAG